MWSSGEGTHASIPCDLLPKAGQLNGTRMNKKQEILQGIEKLEKHPGDWGRVATEIGAVLAGAGGGVASAGAAAGALGVTKIFLLTKAAALIGVTLVAATPVGWVVGLGAAGGAAGYCLVRTAANAGRRQKARDHTLSYLRQQLQTWKDKQRCSSITSADRTQFVIALKRPLEADLVTPEEAGKLMHHVLKGWMSIPDACKDLESLING
jgi:hypothetical protein